jgi:outer membrane lipoprotein-sorting protein
MGAVEALGMRWRQARCRSAALALALLLVPAVAIAAPPPVPLTAQDTLTLQRVAAYLNGIRTMTARFEQASGTGAAGGHLWVARPGRMRFEYDPPRQLLLLADAFYVYYWDPELQTSSKVSLKSTPAWFLLRDPVTFGADVIVTHFEHSGNVVRVSVVEAADPDTGSLTMVFTENPLVLRQWTVVDQKGKVISVALSDIQFGMALDPKLFQYVDPLGRKEQ